jgi:hypothetical protein
MPEYLRRTSHEFRRAMFTAVVVARAAGETELTWERILSAVLRTEQVGRFCEDAGVSIAALLPVVDEAQAPVFSECMEKCEAGLAERGHTFGSHEHITSLQPLPVAEARRFFVRVDTFFDDAPEDAPITPLHLLPVDEARSSPARLRVGFRGPTNGWLALKLDDEDGAALELTVSYTPNDFLVELVWALRSCAGGDGTYEALAHAEPELYVLAFARSAEQVSVSVTEEGAAKVLFTFAGTPQRIVLPFWRALRRLEADFAAAQWRGRFPSDDLAKLTTEIAALK